MKLLSILIAVLCVVSGCARSGGSDMALGSQLDRIKTANVLRVAVKADAPPFGFKMGEDVYAGFEIDIIGAVAREMGIEKIEYVPVTSSERIEALTTDKVDVVIATMTATRSREQHVDFSISYFKDGQMLLTKKDSGIKSYLDLSDKPVACIKGSTSAGNLVVVAPGAKRLVCESNSEMIQLLKTGKVVAITTDGIVLESLRNKNKADGFVVVGDQFSEEPFAIAVPEDSSDLRDAVNNALQEMWETGEWHSIYETWFGEGSGYENIGEFHMQTFPR